MAHTPEYWEKVAVDKYLKDLGAYNAKPATWGYGSSGECDRLVCLKGMFIGIEVKREGKQPTPLQHRRLKWIEQAGGLAVWGTAKKIIKEIDKWRYAKGLTVQPKAQMPQRFQQRDDGVKQNDGAN